MKEPDNQSAPPVLPPQQMGPQPGPPPQRHGTARYVFLFLFFLMAGGFILTAWFFNSISDALAMPNTSTYTEVTMRNGDMQNRIAVVDVRGMISSYMSVGDNMPARIQKQLDLAAADDRIKAVILRIDSPGGEVMASDKIAKSIEAFQNETEKPVNACMEGLAASGGYYVAAPCQLIVANELTITGSIGVIMQSLNLHGLLDKVGVQPVTYKSGKNKDMLDPFGPPEKTTPEQKKILDDFIMETYDKFVAVIEKGRAKDGTRESKTALPLADDWKDFADGRILTGTQAKKLGMVDELGDFDRAVELAEDITGISKGTARIIRHDPPVNLGGILRLLGKAEETKQPPTIKVDLGLEIPKLQPGRAYYLSHHLLAD